MNQLILTKLDKILRDIDDKVDEYSVGITGYSETQYMDIVYENYIVFLESLKNKLEYITEIINTTNESV